MIYFVQAGYGGPIKIGMAGSLKRRLSAMQTHSPANLTVLGTMRGERKEEMALHRKFRELLLRGEWFRCDPVLIEFINGLDVGPSESKRSKRVPSTLKPLTFKIEEAEISVIEREAAHYDMTRGGYLRAIVNDRLKPILPPKPKRAKAK